MKQENIPPQPDESFFPVSPIRRGAQMVDDKTKNAVERIDVHEPYELAYWSRKFGVSVQRLSDAVQKVGTNAEDVAIELGKVVEGGY